MPKNFTTSVEVDFMQKKTKFTRNICCTSLGCNLRTATLFDSINEIRNFLEFNRWKVKALRTY